MGPVDWRLLTKYVAGECSPEDVRAVEAWLAADERRARLMDELQGVWADAASATTAETPSATEVDAAWQRLATRRAREGHIRPLHPRPARPKRRRGRWAPLLRVAAVVAIAAVGVAVLRPAGGFLVPPAEPQPRVYTTGAGQRATIALDDGTTVRLNVESELRVPAILAEGPRAVTLYGEAFFDVARDEARPFTIRAGDAQVEVLGTAFDVRAYAGEADVRVAVAEGRVAFGPAAEADTVVLHPNQLGTFREGRLQPVRRANLSAYLAWLDGDLVFEDAPFPVVARELERWFDLQVALEGSPSRVDRLNANFEVEEESLSDILNAIAAALELDYERDQRSITFYSAASAP